jgi:hypothetical protein
MERKTMSLELVGFPLAGSGGRQVHVNPEQVVCVLDLGGERSQIVTTGLSGENSMSLIVERRLEAVVKALAHSETYSAAAA